MTSRASITLKLSVAAALVAVMFGWPVLAHYRAAANLERYVAGLRAAGEKTTVAELIPTLSADDINAAMRLMASAGRLPAISSNSPPLMKYISPGKAQVGWQQEILPNFEVANVWVELKEPLESNADALAEMRTTLKNNAPAFILNYEQGFTLLLPHLARVKSIAQWFSASTVYDLRFGYNTNALENMATLSELSRTTCREPLIISELVRLAINAIGMATAWEVLQSTDLTEPELREMQTAWQSADFLTQAESALSMERAMAMKTFAAGRKSYSVIANGSFTTTPSATALAELTQMSKDVLENPKDGLLSMAHRYPGYWQWKWWQSYDDETANIETVQMCLEVIHKAQKGQAVGQAAKELETLVSGITQRHSRSGRWLGYSMAAGAVTFIGRISRIEMQRTLLVTAIALKRYQLARGASPRTLNELVPQFLSTIPIDPMDGQPLRYRPGTNSVYVLYSVGDDGLDNGGDPTPNGAMPKHWLRGRDAVWPQAASKAEVESDIQRATTEQRKKEAISREFQKKYGVGSTSPGAGNTNGAGK